MQEIYYVNLHAGVIFVLLLLQSTQSARLKGVQPETKLFMPSELKNYENLKFVRSFSATGGVAIEA